MKKVFFALFVWAVAGIMTANAQSGREHILLSNLKLTDGANSVPVPGGKGTLKFTKRGDTFSNVVFLDSLGITNRLTAVIPGTGGAPKPDCKWPIPDACFSIPNNQNIGMCICKPTDISNGKDYSIALLLPAVQAAREAARRAQ